MKDVVAQPQLIEQIASIHASLPPLTAFVHSLRDSRLDPSARPHGVGETPARWGPLAIVAKMGRVTYADVSLALDPRLDRPVALKLLGHRDANPDALESDTIEEARPQNVMRGRDGRILLTDFGTGREAAQACRRELAG